MMVGGSELIGAAVSDLLSKENIECASVFGVLVQGAIQKSVESYQHHLSHKFVEILGNESKKRQIDWTKHQHDPEFGGMVHRCVNALRNDTARLNLRLMAKTMAGMAQRDRLFAEEFTQYANIISSLSREEVIAVTILHRVQNAHQGIWGDALWKLVEDNSVPRLFPTADHLQSALTGAMRTGLIITRDVANNARNFSTSPLMDEIVGLADFQEALLEEGIYAE